MIKRYYYIKEKTLKKVFDDDQVRDLLGQKEYKEMVLKKIELRAKKQELEKELKRVSQELDSQLYLYLNKADVDMSQVTKTVKAKARKNKDKAKAREVKYKARKLQTTNDEITKNTLTNDQNTNDKITKDTLTNDKITNDKITNDDTSQLTGVIDFNKYRRVR